MEIKLSVPIPVWKKNYDLVSSSDSRKMSIFSHNSIYFNSVTNWMFNLVKDRYHNILLKIFDEKIQVRVSGMNPETSWATTNFYNNKKHQPVAV